MNTTSHKLITTEFEVRELDANGDAIDVSHFNTKPIAIQFAKDLKCVACVVEKHVAKYPAHMFGTPDQYTTLATFGDEAALKEGGWVE